MNRHTKEKKHLSASGLLQNVRSVFNSIAQTEKDPRGKKSSISLTDCLMSGLAVFSLKFPSLLQFDKRKGEEFIKHNLKNLYQVKQSPSDTYMRQCLDEVDSRSLRKAFTKVFNQLQRGKALESYEFINGYFLISLDGTQIFSSSEVHCNQCCEKHHKNGQTTYYHQMLGDVLVHPDQPVVIPLCPEPILKQDGSKKNDCERNASKRLLKDLRREHPHLKTIIIEDALSSNAPHIKELQKLNMRYIIGAKPEGNKSLFEWVNGIKLEEIEKNIDDKTIRIRYINQIPLNDENPDLLVNFLECWETDKKGRTRHFSWITDIMINEKNAYQLTRGGRARWKIENETFNTLKNQGYHFEHNFGHGYKQLSNVFAFLMFLAFLIDQAQQLCCGLFQAALKKESSKRNLWEKIRVLFFSYYIECWKDLFHSIIYGYKGMILTPDTS